MIRGLLLIPLALGAFAGAGFGQANADRILNDRYTRSHDYDLIHQRIEIGKFDWDSLSFTGRVATTLVARRGVMRELLLDAGPLLDIQRVTDRRGALRFEHPGDTLRIVLNRPAAFGDTIRFTVEYRGRVENGKGLTFIPADGRPHRPQQIWSMGETDGNHRWFPTYDFPNDKLTWELAVTVPATYTVVSNGRLATDRRNRDGSRTVVWAQERPASIYLASIVVAPLVRIRDGYRRLPLEYYVYPEDSALARPLFGITPDVIAVYERLTGVRYPWSKYAQTTVADFFGGMENVSATTLVDWLPDRRAYLDRPWYRRVLIPHELAHQWFGDLVTISNWANMWLNEGFAQFMPGQYWREKLGRQAEDDYYLEDYRSTLEIDARRRMPLASLGSNNVYPKGSLVLRMLKYTLGEERFWAAIKHYLDHYAYANVTSDDLRQAILEATGENLSWFFDQWVYRAGYPELTVRATYDSAARSLALSVKQTQVDTLKPDSGTGLRFEVPEVFRGRITVRAGTAAGDVVREVELDRREQTIQLPDLAGPPTMVVFDDGNHLLKTLDFDQPTAWLATQLERDSDLWNRSWVIRQLATRTGDAEAGAALATAARTSDYFLTRAAAAEALGRFPDSVAMPALEAATRDTSAQVRESAVAALGGMGNVDALTLARSALDRDSSYEVRAAALVTVAQLDSAGAADVILAGLRTPSYRDAVQNAALALAVRLGDSTLVPALDERIGDQPLPALALAAFAARGNGLALDALTRRLDDDRAWVRRWSLEAFRRGVGPVVGLPRLKSVVDRLNHADTKAAAVRLIAAMEEEGAVKGS